jgi:hypothetical protein
MSLPVKNELLSNPSRAASWILLRLEREQHEAWDHQSCALMSQGSIFQWVEAYSDSRLRELSPSGWRAQDRASPDQRGDRFISRRKTNPQGTWRRGEPRLAREGIAKHLQKISLQPMHRTCVASGNCHSLGNVANCVVPGARIELATPAFSGRRSTTELPRQSM